MLLFAQYTSSQIMEAVAALSKAGWTKSDALILIANNWQSIQLAKDFPGISLEN